MKILMLGWELPPHNSGGLGVACFYMAKAMANAGAEIDFVVPYSEQHDDIKFMNVLNATHLSALHKFGAGAYDSANFRIRSEYNSGSALDIRSIQLEYMAFIEKLLEDKDAWPEIIHAHDWLTMEAGKRASEITGAPLITHMHATEFDRAGGSVGNPNIHHIEYEGASASAKVFAVSKNTRQIIIDKYKIDPSKVEVVYNAIEPGDMASLEDYDQETYRYLEYLKTQGYTILMTLTRFTVQKGLTYLMEATAKAAAKNPKIALLLVGDGEQRNELIRMAASYGIADKVFFTGFLRGDRWRDSYGVADVFALSSVNEPFGLTALEAAHFNNALILSHQSGVAEVLNSVLKYDFWDVEKLARQIVAVSTSPSLLKSLKDGVRKEYTRISWRDIAEQIMDEFYSVLGGRDE